MIKKIVTLAVMLAASLAAQDFSGIWNGTGGKVDSHYGTVPATAQMTVLQAGNSFSGTFKLGNNKPVTISAGAVSGSQLNFVVNGFVTGTLSFSGANLTGKMTSNTGDVYNFVFTKN
jgi:hypothetical protein